MFGWYPLSACAEEAGKCMNPGLPPGHIMLGTNAGSMLTSNQRVNQNQTLQTGLQAYVPRNGANVDMCIYMLATTSSDEYGLLMYVQCCKLLQIHQTASAATQSASSHGDAIETKLDRHHLQYQRKQQQQQSSSCSNC